MKVQGEYGPCLISTTYIYIHKFPCPIGAGLEVLTCERIGVSRVRGGIVFVDRISCKAVRQLIEKPCTAHLCHLAYSSIRCEAVAYLQCLVRRSWLPVAPSV